MIVKDLGVTIVLERPMLAFWKYRLRIMKELG